MDEIKRILVVSRSTKYCQKAVQAGVSLAGKYGAELYVFHAIHNPFGLQGWNLPLPSIPVLAEEYKNMQQEAKSDLDKMIASAQAKGMPIHVLVVEGDPNKEIFKIVKKEKIDLLIMLAHEEGRLEHFLSGRSNEVIIRQMPCSIMLVKKEPGPAAY